MRNYSLKHGSWRNVLPILVCIICVHVREGHSVATSKFSPPNNKGLRTSVEKLWKIRIAIMKVVFKVH